MIPRRLDAAGRLRRLRMILLRCRGMGRVAADIVQYLDVLEERHGRATPSRAGIAAAIGCCERSVSRAVRRLEAAGLVSVWRDKPYAVDGTWCRRRTNYYRLAWPTQEPAKAQVNKRGHAMPVYAFHEAIEPRGGVPRATPAPQDPVAPTLFEPETPAEPASAPPNWRTLGMTYDEWRRAGCPTP